MSYIDNALRQSFKVSTYGKKYTCLMQNLL